MFTKSVFTLMLTIASINFSYANYLESHQSLVDTTPKPIAETKKSWTESFSIRGYLQVRYNRLLETNDLLKCEQCDRSWGENGGFFIRRARIIFSGNIHDRVYMYIQPDFASSASTTNLHFAQIRDAYFDVALDAKKEFRVRIGQSKIPYGFENMQSSQNRLPLDRHDALNSAVSNERDLGAVTRNSSLPAAMTPIINDAIETKPSLAPRTAARNHPVNAKIKNYHYAE